MKKITALILTLALLCTLALSLTACGISGGDDAEKSESSSAVVGTWNADFPVGKIMESVMGLENIDDPTEKQMFADALKNIVFEDYTAKTTFVLKSNGKYSIDVAKDEMSTVINAFVTKFGNSFADSLIAMVTAGGATLEETVGMTKEQIVEMFLQQFNSDEIQESLESLSESGKYTLKDNILSLKNEDGNKTEFEIETKDDTLVLVNIVSDDNEDAKDAYSMLLPWTFTKAK